MDNELWVILLPITLLPVFFAMGWFAARIDMKTVLKQAKSVPAGFYKSLDALVDRNSGRAARELAEVIDQQPQSYDLNLTLGKLYRQRGENDKAINMHQALLDSPDTVNEKRARVLFELAQNYQSAGLVDRAEQIFIGLQEGNMAREARQHLLSIYQQDRDWEKAIETAQLLSHDEQTYQFEIAHLDAISASVIGGVSFSGGIGTIPGVIIGAIILQFINYGLAYVGVNPNYQYIIKGLIIILAVAIDVRKYIKRK